MIDKVQKVGYSKKAPKWRVTKPMKRLLAVITLAAAFLASAALSPAQEATKNAAVIPLAKPADKNWMARHEMLVSIAKKGDIDVLFLGDSITERWANNAAWRKSFAPLKAANFGIGGDRTENVLWRITEGKEIEGIDPKVAVLLIGANNFNMKGEEIADGITAIVAELRKAKPRMKVLLLGVFPRGPRKPSDPTKVVPEEQAKTNAINDRIAKLDDGKGVFFMDIGGKFLNKEGNLLQENMPDFLHLSPKGYEIWADAIEGEVKELLK
jgi:lysophospholipase L1-like esterase